MSKKQGQEKLEKQMKGIPPKNFERLVDFEELAHATGLTIPFLKKAKKLYSLPFYKIGGNVRFRLSEINEWVGDRFQGKQSHSQVTSKHAG